MRGRALFRRSVFTFFFRLIPACSSLIFLFLCSGTLPFPLEPFPCPLFPVPPFPLQSSTPFCSAVLVTKLYESPAGGHASRTSCHLFPFFGVPCSSIASPPRPECSLDLPLFFLRPAPYARELAFPPLLTFQPPPLLKLFLQPPCFFYFQPLALAISFLKPFPSTSPNGKFLPLSFFLVGFGQTVPSRLVVLSPRKGLFLGQVGILVSCHEVFRRLSSPPFS